MAVMFFFRTNPLSLFLFLISFFIFSTFFNFSHGASDNEKLQQGQLSPELAGGIPSNGTLPWEMDYNLDETSHNSTVLILAAKRTHRRDPSNGFKYYTGGWNITSKNYIYSLVFSAVGPFITGALWFMLFGLCLLCICCRRCCCCVSKKYGYSRAAYAISLILLILLTIAAITGTGFLYAGQGKFNSSLVDTMCFVLKEADGVIVRLKDLLNTLLAAKDLRVAQVALDDEGRAQIDNMKGAIDAVMANFRNVTGKSSSDIHDFIAPLRRTLLYLAAALLILAVLGFLFSILGLSCLVYSLVILGWILVVGTFSTSGMFLVVHNAVSDTCVAMDEWLQNPNTSSALENLIPKVEPEVAQQISTVTKGVTFGTVNAVNNFIKRAANKNNMPPDAGPLYYNQSGRLMPVLCNPYTSNLTDHKCAPNEVPLSNASQAFESYVCQVSASGKCTTPGRLTPEIYKELTATTNVSYGLYSGMPFAIGLIDSTFLKETFAHISEKNCPSLRLYTMWMYSGFITSSVAVMLSLILWVVYARERRHRAYTKKIDNSRRYSNHFGGNI